MRKIFFLGVLFAHLKMRLRPEFCFYVTPTGQPISSPITLGIFLHESYTLKVIEKKNRTRKESKGSVRRIDVRYIFKVVEDRFYFYFIFAQLPFLFLITSSLHQTFFLSLLLFLFIRFQLFIALQHLISIKSTFRILHHF